MKFSRLFSLAALALMMSLGLSDRSEAAYSYSTSLVINSVSGSGGVIMNTPLVGATFTSTNGTTLSLQDIPLPGLFLPSSPLSANIGNVGITTTSAVPDSFSVNYTDEITITNPAPGGSTGTFTISGTLTLSNVQTSGGASGGMNINQYSGVFTQSAVIGPNGFTVSFGNGLVNNLYGPATVNSATAQGSLGALITPGAVPEPASLTMLGLGLAGVAGLGVYRRRHA